jgi:hypothetical protein
MKKFVNKITTALDEGLKRFGTYNYYDKGPDEIMDVRTLSAQLVVLSKEDITFVLNGVKNYGEHGEHLANSFLVDLQDLPDSDWDYIIDNTGLEL